MRVIIAAMLFAACAARDTRPPAPRQVSIFFTAELHGYLTPCGCSESMRGGIARAAAQLEKARAGGRSVFYVDSGSGLFGAESIPEEAVAQQERKARALADSLKAMGVSVRAPGQMDDARGAPFRAGLALPELARGQVHWLERRIAVVSAPDVKTANVLAPRDAAFVVALVPQPIDAALREAGEAQRLDLVITSRPRDDANRLAGASTRVAQLQDRGRALLRVDLTLEGDGHAAWLKGTAERDRELGTLDERIELLRAQLDAPGLGEPNKALRRAKLEELVARRAAIADAPLETASRSFALAQFIPLEPSLPEDPRVKAIEDAYERDVGLINLAWAQANGEACEPPDLAREGFVGSEACVGCHPDAAHVWKATKHVQAYASLEQKSKQYHLDCVGCHVTGWKQPGGVCRIDDVEGRREVGCESCHGPGWRHTQMPEAGQISLGREARACVTCHDAENSPHFEFDAYLAEIVGPGHGKPLPDGGMGRGLRTRP